MTPPSPSEPAYGWPSIDERLRGLPLFFADLDGTLRGDVGPMVRLARPLVPNFAAKVLRQEPVNFTKTLRFLGDIGTLWILRMLHRQQRRRYKYLFSELHQLAGALLRDVPVEAIQRKYAKQIPHMHGLWHDGAIKFLRRLTQRAIVVLVTGSEQLQTQECVRLLAAHGVDIGRIVIRGSLYGWDPASGRFTGGVQHLNISLDGKRDAVRQVLESFSGRVVGAVGNSRPDRALFEVVSATGLCVLVCAESVIRKRKEYNYVVRKLRRNGYALCWDAVGYLDALAARRQEGPRARPILATDSTFRSAIPCLEWVADRLAVG